MSMSVSGPHEHRARHLSRVTGAERGLTVPGPYGNYWLVERLGTGGMAEVYRAQTHEGSGSTGDSFVIKRLKPFYAHDEAALRMFAEEAKLAASIRHPNIVPVYELVQLADGETFITMEHVDGPDLRWLLNMVRRRGRRLPVWFSIFICSEVLQALEFLSELTDPIYGERNLVHCDVTPENVFISSTGTVKLGDFGVAVEDARPEDHHLGQLRGKLPYCSPEQAQGQRLDARSDVYSVATVLWECLAGRPLVHVRSREEAFRAVLSSERPRPSSLNSEVSALLDDVVLAALSPDRSRRTPSAAVLRNRLARVLDSLHPPVTREHVVAAMSAVLAPPPRGASRPARPTTPTEDPAERLLASAPEVRVQTGAVSLPAEDLPFATWVHHSQTVQGPMALHDAVAQLESVAVHNLQGMGLSVTGRDPVSVCDLMQLLGIDLQTKMQGRSEAALLPLQRSSLPSLFAKHTRARSSGVLVARSGDASVEHRIRIAEGCLVDVWSAPSTLRTWSVLTDPEHQDAEDFAAAIHRCLADRHPVFDRLSAKMQAILQDARLFEVHRQLEEMFGWEQGETCFVSADVSPVAGAPLLAGLVPQLLLSALDAPQLMRRLDPYLTRRVVAVPRVDAEMGDGGLSDSERRLVQVVLHADTLAEGLARVPEDDRFVAGSSIYAMHAVGLLRFV